MPRSRAARPEGVTRFRFLQGHETAVWTRDRVVTIQGHEISLWSRDEEDTFQGHDISLWPRDEGVTLKKTKMFIKVQGDISEPNHLGCAKGANRANGPHEACGDLQGLLLHLG